MSRRRRGPSFDRRFLLKAGGASLALPFLHRAVGSRPARASADAPPTRLLVFHHSQGQVLPLFTPTGSETAFTLPHVLEPLAAFQDQMVVLTGLDNRSASLNTVGNAHQNANFTLFTGRPFPVQDASRITGADASIEQLLTDRIGGDTPFGRLDFAVGGSHSAGGFYTTDRFFYGLGDPVASFNDPFTAISRIFGDQTMSPEDAWALRARRSAVLDAVLDNFRLARRELTGAERARLDAHEDKVLQLEQRIRGGVGACTPPSWTEPGGYDLLYDDDLSAPILTDIAVSALSCDYARVVTVEFANGHDHAFDWLWGDNGGPIVDTSAYDNWHAMVHADFQDGMEHVYRWYMEQLADVIGKLATTPDADGNMLLDSTLVLYIPEFSSGRHWVRGMPAILAGNLGGATPGRWLDYMGGTLEEFLDAGSYLDGTATTNQLFTSVLQMFGFDDEGFGHHESDWPTGALPGLLG